MSKKPWTRHESIGVWLGFVGLVLTLTYNVLEIRALIIAGFFVIGVGLGVMIGGRIK